jgi:prepilin-type N-terminal cleavage/methylation domain-containing protein/prepilin-type processing-associated H-X9-DG protein
MNDMRHTVRRAFSMIELPAVRHAFSMIELLVVIGIITLLIGIIVPTMGKVREKSYINRCAENLHQIGEALSLYATDNHGAYPRTTYVPGAPLQSGTGPGAADPFAVDGPSANDTTSAIFLLMRTEKLAPETFLCPYVNHEDVHPDITIEHARSNFSDFHRNLGYSFANPYPDSDAVASGYEWTSKLPPEFVLAADINPGVDGERDDVNLPTLESNPREMAMANSNNHGKDGQNVLFADGHVSFEDTAFCGVDNDNIYNNKRQEVNASPADKSDTVLLPTDD